MRFPDEILKITRETNTPWNSQLLNTNIISPQNQFQILRNINIISSPLKQFHFWPLGQPQTYPGQPRWPAFVPCPPDVPGGLHPEGGPHSYGGHTHLSSPLASKRPLPTLPRLCLTLLEFSWHECTGAQENSPRIVRLNLIVPKL